MTGIGVAVVLAFVMAGDLSGRAETAALGGVVAKPKEKATEKVPAKVAEKTPEKSPAKILPGGPNRIPLPRARPQPAAGTPFKTASLGPAAAAPAAPSAAPPAASLGISATDLATLKEAITLARNSKTGQVTDLQKTIADPLARKLVEWVLLRSDNNTGDYSRYAAFVSANPSWPSIGLLRRRAEAMVWQEQPEPASVRAIFGKEQPVTAKGHFALARALLAIGDRAGAQAQLRGAWRNEALSNDLEDQVLDTFKDLLTPADHQARMNMRFYVEDVDAGLRAASRAGPTAQAIGRAWAAVIRKAPNAKALLEAVPAEASRDLGYTFARAQWLRREDMAAEAAELILSVPRDAGQSIDADQWWVERRVLARKLLDLDDPRTAYRIASDAAVPNKENYRGEQQFTAGWIALRFLDDPSTAIAHFAKVAQGTSNPITHARAGYWQGRAAEALGRKEEARGYYEAAARHATAYYGQLARARLGYQDIALRSPPEPSPERRAAIAQLDVVRATELLYAVGERDLVVPFVADLGERSTDIAALAALGEVTARNKDARCMLLIGKAALARGYALEHYAFPTIGIPDYRAIGPAVDRSVVYSIARQESIFYQGTVSSAKAMGLMQVTPEAGRESAKKYGATYDLKRLLSDSVYNVQMGAAELGELMEGYRGSYILTFAGYNAGRGRVREWLSRYGDPRDPKVDPVDWVERIPFSETRNYVERVLENLQVYRVRLGGGPRLMIEADLHRGAATD
ncbi:MAG TPA: lytic transglycosylase domain-containing protein [Xanthobacteraceae bacterium]|nr:lytic transglycosylase domain-containing protein [Xanthobacteraceae bacterium]